MGILTDIVGFLGIAYSVYTLSWVLVDYRRYYGKRKG